MEKIKSVSWDDVWEAGKKFRMDRRKEKFSGRFENGIDKKVNTNETSRDGKS